MNPRASRLLVLTSLLILAAPGFAQPSKQNGVDLLQYPRIWYGCALAPVSLKAWVVPTWDDTGVLVYAYSSTDYGTHWRQKRFATDNPQYDIFFLDSLNGWTCGWIAEVWHTTDGGDSWRWQDFGCSYYATRIVFLDPTHGWFSCDKALMGRWDDSLQCWNQMITPYPDFKPDSTDFQGISFVDTLHGWMCAGIYSRSETMACGQGYIAYTYNDCDTWIRQVRDTINDYYGVKFTDLNHGVVVGGSDRTEQGYIAMTTDGGQTWTPVAIPPTTAFLRNVAFPDARHGWAVGQQGTIVHTSDGGRTWAMQTSGTDSILYDVDFTDSLHGLVSGGHVVLFTSDGGNTWTISPVAVAEEKTLSSSPTLSLTATPNLFTGSTTLTYALPADPSPSGRGKQGEGANLARLEIRDITGRLVRTESPLTPALSPKGRGSEGRFTWDGTDDNDQRLPSGCYFCTLRVGTQTAKAKVLLTR